jgi:SSS family solute:Na+ symporter
LTTALVTVVAVLWSPQIAQFPSLWQYLQSVLSYITPPVVAVFLTGIFWRRATPTAAFVTLLAGVLGGVVGFIANEIVGVFDIQFLYAAGLQFLIAITTIIAVSRVTEPAPYEQISALVWRPELWHAETEALKGVALLKNYRVLSVALLAVTFSLVAMFR